MVMNVICADVIEITSLVPCQKYPKADGHGQSAQCDSLNTIGINVQREGQDIFGKVQMSKRASRT